MSHTFFYADKPYEDPSEEREVFIMAICFIFSYKPIIT
jgi:hypothetical protein